MASLQGRHALVTGGGRGIGRAIAAALSEAGATVTIAGRSEKPLAEAVGKGDAKGYVIADVTDAKAVDNGIKQAVAARGPVDLLIANAGVSIDQDNSSLHDFSIIRKTFAINVDGVFNTVEPLVGRLIERQRGQLAVVSSLAGFIGLPYAASYNGSKAAIRVWAESLRYVLRKSGVGVSVICPGFVVSRLTSSEAPSPGLS